MATFTVDLLSGNVYLFSGEFGGTGSTPTSGSTYPQVSNFASLPTPTSQSNQIYLVRNGNNTTVLNRKPAGLYYSNGIVWRYLGDTPEGFKSNNFQILDNDDNSKGVMFETSGITTNTFRKLKIQDNDGTIAYLSDVDGKVDLSVFDNYTGSTIPANYYNKSEINSYSGTTLLLINNKQDKLTAGNGISIVGTTISVTGITSSKPIQLIDSIGGVNVNNITPSPINWGVTLFSGTSLYYSGGSRIYVLEDGVYGISYILNVNGADGSDKNIGTHIRKNSNVDITPMSSASFFSNYQNDSATNIMPENYVSLVSGDYIELLAFRIGYAGQVYTIANASWIKIEKKNII